ncbi:MAG: MFS transporter, partial [Verrucomicrobiales bacterium]|nr:MFS transporter [Verrucomicrobiales bacterium]
YIPAALALIAESHDASTRSRAVGAHQTGIYAGIILGGFCGYAAESPHVGWRRMFEISGVLGVLYALPLFLALPRTPAPTPSLAPSAPHDSLLRTVRGLVRQPPFLLLAAYFTLPAMAGWIVRDWMPAVLKSEFGIGQGRAGVSATLYWMTASVIGAFLGGWIADRWAQRNHRGRIYVSAIGVAATVVALLGVGYAPATGRLAIAVAFLVLFGLGWGVYDANNMPILAQILPARNRAAGYGCMNLVSIGCGGFADRWFGLLRDHHVPMPAIFGLFASLGMLAIALVLALRPSQTERARASNPS